MRTSALALSAIAVAAAAALSLPAFVPAAAKGGAESSGKHLQVQAKAALLVDANTGEELFRKDPDSRLPVASTTKLMTALLVLERARLNERFMAPAYSPGPIESVIHLSAGEWMSVRDLLYALLLESANDAAVTIAEGVGGSQRGFIRAMNNRARELGLINTHYANPIGLDDPDNYSSARDLARLSRRLLRNRTFRRVADTATATLTTGAYRRRIATRNTLLFKEDFVTGVKTGHTLQAGWCLVGSASRRGVSLITVVLGAPSELGRDTQTLKLMRYGFSRYRTITPVKRGVKVASVDIEGRSEQVPLVPWKTLKVAVRRGRPVTTRVDAPEEVEQTKRGQILGRVVVESNGRVLKAARLRAADSVEAAGFIRVAYNRYRWFLATVGLLLIALATVVLGGRRRARHRIEVAGRRRVRAQATRNRRTGGEERGTGNESQGCGQRGTRV